MVLTHYHFTSLYFSSRQSPLKLRI